MTDENSPNDTNFQESPPVIEELKSEISLEGESSETPVWESRLANAEAQIVALQDGLSELYLERRAAKQRALMIRLGLLAIAFGALIYMRAGGSLP